MARERLASPPQGALPDIPINPAQIVFSDAAPAHLIDGIAGIAIVNGIVRIVCFTMKQTAPDEQHPVVTANLHFSIPTLMNMHQAVSGLLQELEKNGVIAKP